jgi:DNA-damage-inducible protein J
MKTEIIHARIEPFLKQSAEKIFRKLGMTTSEAISIFMGQVVLNKGLPFSVNIPNAETRKAIAEVKAGKGKKYNSVQELFDDLNR